MNERAACWHCDRDADGTSLDYDSVLVPRSARDGGPVVTWECPGCGRLNLVEKNAAGERLLVPPLVRGVKADAASGAGRVEERRWAAANAARRTAFHARAGSPDGTKAPDPVPPPDGEPPGREPESDPAPEPAREAGSTRTSPREVSTLLTAYEILDLPLTAGADEIRKRFRELSKKCHPDRVAGLDEEIRRTAERRFREIRRAYDLLSGE